MAVLNKKREGNAMSFRREELIGNGLRNIDGGCYTGKVDSIQGEYVELERGGFIRIDDLHAYDVVILKENLRARGGQG